MTFIVDTLLAGHFIDADSVAAIAIGLPSVGITASITAMILQGGYLKMLSFLGKSDMKGYNRILSIALTMTIFVDIILVLLCFFATDFLIAMGGGAKATQTAVIYADLYIKAASVMVFFFAIGSIFQLVCATFGYQNERMISSLLNVIVNIVVSIALIKIMPEELRIAGLGIGLIYSAALAAIIIIFHKPILGFFGYGDNAQTTTGIILIAIAGMIVLFQYIFNAAYEATNRLTFALIFAVVSDSILFPLFILILGRFFGIYGIWMTMGYSFVIFFAVYYLIFSIVKRKARVPLEEFLLLEKNDGRDTAIDISVPVDSEHVSFVSEKLQNFFLKHDTPSKPPWEYI